MATRHSIELGAPKRAAVLKAGLELFAERGFHGTTVPEIAARAGVGTGTLYRYFPSKESLVNELYQYWKREYTEALVAGLRPAAAPRSLFHDIWIRMRTFASNQPLVLDFLELHHHGSYLDEESRGIERRTLEKLKGFVVDAQNAQVIRRMSPEVVIAMVWGAFNGLFRASQDGYLKLGQKIYDEAEEAVWAAIRV